MNSYLNNLWPVRNFTRTTHEMCEHANGWQQGEGVKFTSAQVWEQQLWGKTVVRNRLFLSDESYTGRKKHLFFKAVAPALPNPRWLNSCTYVPWRRLIFSPQWARRKKWGREKSKGEERTGRRQTEVGWYLLNSVTALTRNTFCPSAACFYSPFFLSPHTRRDESQNSCLYKRETLKGTVQPPENDNSVIICSLNNEILVVHETFRELRSTTALQHSPTQLKKHKTTKNIPFCDVKSSL